ncbi:phage terminase small subunit P27 family [Ferrovum myxofaciens]|uniref:phage terminase small subunit P27 family n=1 Tax=Ferrovum myxofaciens TaxID=416213 RepID=UPI002356BDFF|nr:phage terminase small subunit P27 family [Ferrovum myxofaciens]MBU6995870.1 phage terminase small subunit P27 family [Ferrovum myxofaciens]
MKNFFCGFNPAIPRRAWAVANWWGAHDGRVSPQTPSEARYNLIDKAMKMRCDSGYYHITPPNPMPGRKPLPTAIKKIKGTLQKCRTNRNEPRPTGVLCDPPEYMADSAKEAWHYAVTNSPPGLLSALDGAVLERWANCSGMYREALAKINRSGVSGMLMKTPSGFLRRSPLMDVIRDLALEMKGYESELGFTPASRSRVTMGTPAVDEHDPWANFPG